MSDGICDKSWHGVPCKNPDKHRTPSLPKWVKEAKKEARNVFEIQLVQSLTIAIEALKNIADQEEHEVGELCVYWCDVGKAAAKDTLAQIEKMGEGK